MPAACARLAGTLVGEEEIDLSEHERRERPLGLGLDEFAARCGRFSDDRGRTSSSP
jgi:hypothetical protein